MDLLLVSIGHCPKPKYGIVFFTITAFYVGSGYDGKFVSLLLARQLNEKLFSQIRKH